MNYTIINKEHEEAVKDLWAYCFESHEPFFSWYFREYYQRENTLGAIDAAGNLLANLQLIPYTINLRDTMFNTSYVVGVATWPEGRNGGLVGNLLKAAIEEMDKRKQAVSLLMPFQGQFYYPYQWTFCYYHYKYNIAIQDLRNLIDHYGYFLPLKGIEKLEQLNEVYESFVKDKNGFVIRDEQKWRLLLEEHYGEKGYAYLLVEAGVPQGYILYYLKDNSFIVREMVYKSFKAQKALLGFVYNHRSQVSKLEWHAPFNDGIHNFLPDPKEGITLYPFLMARIVNVQRALEKIQYPNNLNASLILDVEDKFAPWNNKCFKLQVENSQISVAITCEQPDALLSIDALTQLVYGAIDAKELVYQKRLHTKNAQVMDSLSEMFPKCTNYINEYY